MNQHWDPEGTARGRVVLLHGIMSTAATWWRVGPARAREDHASTLADGIDADARLVRGDRRRLVRREREANPAWADEDVEHAVDGIAAADTAALAAGLRAELALDLPAMVAAVRVPLLVLAAGAGAGLGEAGAAPSTAPTARPCGPCCRRTGS